MKRTLGIILTILLLGSAILAGIVFAQEGEKPDKDVQRPMRRGMAGMGGPGMRGMGPMNRQGPGGPGSMGMMPRRGVMGNPNMLMRLADKLELSEEQRNEIKDMFTTHRKDMIRMNADLELARVDMENLMSQREPDLDAIRGKINDIASLEAEMKFSQVKLQINSKNVLTEGQREKLRELAKDGQGPMMRGRMGMRRGAPEAAPRQNRGYDDDEDDD